MLSFLFTADEDGVHNKAWSDIKIWFGWLQDAIDDYNASLNGTKPSISNFITSLKQSKVNAEAAGEATEGFSLKLLALRAKALLLNAVLGVGIGLLVSWGTKKITEASQRVQNVATKSKEAADAAQSTTSSLKDLVSAYEELGDKSGWDTEDFDQAKDIQAEILDLAKEQGTLDENKLGKLDLQNGKYEEQLGILQDITAEQLEASCYELTQNKDAQGNKLVDTAKKNNRTHYLTVWSAPEMDMGDQIKNAGIDIFNKFGGYGPDKLNDADSIVDYYNEVGKALKYVIDNTTEAERAAGGTYHSLYQFLLDEQSALRDDVDSYNDSTDAINTLTKLNNLYSMLKTGEYKDLGIKGLWDTIKGFFNKGKSENVNKSFKDTFNAAKKAFNAGKKQLTDTATTGATDVINAMINQIKTSGNGLIETFGGIWDKIKVGAQSLFRGSGSGGGIISTFVNGFKAIGNAVSKSKIGSTILGGIGKVGTTLLSGGGKLLAGAGKLIGTAGSALAAAGPYAIPIAAAAGLGIYGGIKSVKHQKDIWSNKEDGFGKKAVKSIATFFWDSSPIGMIVNLCKDISGKSKKTAENTKDTADSSSETAENTKHSATNLTINATQIVSKEENKVTDATDKKNDITGNEDQTVKTAATTLTGAGLGAAAGMAIGGPAGALIGTLLGGFAGFFFGRHANGLKSSKTNHFANVDERGSELIVRKPASGRYTYLETGDGVVPADITSRLFEMGGNPDKWFSDQLAKHSSASMVQSRDAGGISLSIGDVNVNNPVGDSDALARELVNRLPNKVVQELNRR